MSFPIDLIVYGGERPERGEQSGRNWYVAKLWSWINTYMLTNVKKNISKTTHLLGLPSGGTLALVNKTRTFRI